MNKKTPVPAYKLLSNPSNKLKLFINHYESPCMYGGGVFRTPSNFAASIDPLEIILHRYTDRESTYCQALLYEQRLQKLLMHLIL